MDGYADACLSGQAVTNAAPLPVNSTHLGHHTAFTHLFQYFYFGHARYQITDTWTKVENVEPVWQPRQSPRVRPAPRPALYPPAIHPLLNPWTPVQLPGPVPYSRPMARDKYARDASNGVSRSVSSRYHRKKPPINTREKKGEASKALGNLIAGAFAATEAVDALKAVHDALPKEFQKGTTPAGMVQDLFNHWEHLSVPQAAANLVYNHYEDKVVGGIAGGASKSLGDLGMSHRQMPRV